MRTLLLLSFAACTGAAMPDAQPLKNPGEWTSVGTSSLGEVSVERALYEVPNDPHFFVHVRIDNHASTAIGVDLRQYFTAFYPNQWGASSSLHRGVVDERRFILAPFDAAAQGAVLANHREGVLTTVPVRGAVDYYTEFNASGRAAVDTQAAGLPYVLIAIDGQLRLSDGHIAERIEPTPDDNGREIAVPAPVRWASVPAGAIVIRSR